MQWLSSNEENYYTKGIKWIFIAQFVQFLVQDNMGIFSCWQANIAHGLNNNKSDFFVHSCIFGYTRFWFGYMYSMWVICIQQSCRSFVAPLLRVQCVNHPKIRFSCWNVSVENDILGFSRGRGRNDWLRFVSIEFAIMFCSWTDTHRTRVRCVRNVKTGDERQRGETSAIDTSRLLLNRL